MDSIPRARETMSIGKPLRITCAGGIDGRTLQQTVVAAPGYEFLARAPSPRTAREAWHGPVNGTLFGRLGHAPRHATPPVDSLISAAAAALRYRATRSLAKPREASRSHAKPTPPSSQTAHEEGARGEGSPLPAAARQLSWDFPARTPRVSPMPQCGQPCARTHVRVRLVVSKRVVQHVRWGGSVRTDMGVQYLTGEPKSVCARAAAVVGRPVVVGTIVCERIRASIPRAQETLNCFPYGQSPVRTGYGRSGSFARGSTYVRAATPRIVSVS